MSEIKEAVALELLKIIASVEGKCLDERALAKPDRNWVLTAYAECLNAVMGARPKNATSGPVRL